MSNEIETKETKNVIINKAGIQPIPIDTFMISSNEVIKYLEDTVLGFKVGYDFTRWTGVTANHSYVRMRVVISPKDILAPRHNNDYADKILAENAAGLTYKKEIIDALEPFMYPKTIGNLRNHPDELQRMYQYGLFGDRLDEVIQNSQLAYSADANYFRLYLRPERIIADMLKNPETDKIDGAMSIVAVHATSSETIRWEVEVVKNGNLAIGNNDVSVDAIFNHH